MANSRTKDFTISLPYEAPCIEVIEIDPVAVLCSSSGSKGSGNKLNKYDIII